MPVNLQHHDRASLLAGKLHALLQREYVKGRDWYDLYWYLQQLDWPEPNINMLNSALQQSNWDKELITSNNWRTHLNNRLEQIQWPRIVNDVQRFIITQDELPAFSKETIQKLLDAGVAK